MTVRPPPAPESASPPASAAEGWSDSFARSLEQQRSRAQELLQSERERIRHIESTLTELVQELGGELLATESRLHRLEQEVGGRDVEVEQLRAQLVDRQGEIKRYSETLAGAAPLASAESEGEVERSQAALASAEKALAESQAEQEELRQQLARAKKQLNLRAQELNDLRAQLAELTNKQVDPDALNAAAYEDLAELRAQRQDLIERLADAETRLKKAAQIDVADVDNLRRRFEMAVQDVRELKARNAELERQKKTPTVVGKPGVEVAAMDWESQKQRMLAQLEADHGDQDPARKRERLSIEETIRATDRVVMEYENEIAELKQLLEQQSGSIGSVAVGAAAIAGILDQDELICQERSNLRQLEEQWRQKLRQAEVDISLERAKLARERSQFEERLQTFETERASLVPNSEVDGAGGKAGSKKGAGRWLTRMGLKDES